MPTSGLGDVIATSLFAYGLMAVIAFATAGFVAALVAGLAAFGRRAEAQAAARTATSSIPVPEPARPDVAPAATEGPDPAIVAAISAAIQAVVGSHRIVFIGESPAASGWTGEVRQLHHGSHHPHHER